MQWLLFGDVAEVSGNKRAEVAVDDRATVEDALEALVAAHPALEDIVFHDGMLADDAHVLHNHHSVIDAGDLNTELTPGDELALFRLDTNVEG